MKTIFRIFFVFFFFGAASFAAQAQKIADKMLVSVSDGVQTELITYSDLQWKLALEPEAALESPSNEVLNGVLRILIRERLIALEAERLPSSAPSADDVNKEIRRLAAQFAAPSVFEARLRRVGFASTDDPNFRRIIERRLAIDKYLDFRFRSFIVVTPSDEEKYYKETFVPNFRRENPNRIVPNLETVRAQINEELVEQKVADSTTEFLNRACENSILTPLDPKLADVARTDFCVSDSIKFDLTLDK
jgi:hypothetical protein